MKVNFIKNNGKEVRCEYRKRKNSKYVKMSLDENGIVKVSVPYYTSYTFANIFVNKNISWINRRLEYFEGQKSKYYYLGEDIILIKKNCANIKSFNYIKKDNLLIVDATKNCSLTNKELYMQWLGEKASEYIPKRTNELSKLHGFDYNSIKIKNLTSRWGSCSAKKTLSFNLKLMYFNYQVIDYVIIHELCHLREMNHSKRFWNLVEDIIPNYKEYRTQLNNLSTHNQRGSRGKAKKRRAST